MRNLLVILAIGLTVLAMIDAHGHGGDRGEGSHGRGHGGGKSGNHHKSRGGGRGGHHGRYNGYSLDFATMEALECDYKHRNRYEKEAAPTDTQVCSEQLRDEDEVCDEANIRFTFNGETCVPFCGCKPTSPGNNFRSFRKCVNHCATSNNNDDIGNYFF